MLHGVCANIYRLNIVRQTMESPSYVVKYTSTMKIEIWAGDNNKKTDLRSVATTSPFRWSVAVRLNF